MERVFPEGPNARFRSDKIARQLFPDAAAADLAANAADLTLLIDDKGVIRDASFPGDDFKASEFESWIGRKWVDVSTPESAAKIAALLGAAAAGPGDKRRWRQINHPQPADADLPIRYFTLPASQEGWVLAIGRDMRAQARMQQRLMQAQMEMEREYENLREAETRFRMLFQAASEGVLIIAGDSYRVTDANPAAARLLGLDVRELRGAALDKVFGESHVAEIKASLAVARKSGLTERYDVKGNGAGQGYALHASVFRQGGETVFLVRLSAPVADLALPAGPDMSHLAEIVPDGLVLTSEDGGILVANGAFVELAQCVDAEALKGVPIERFIGRTEVEFNVLIANVREHGSVRNFATVINSQHGVREDVEVSAVSAPGPNGRVFGFSFRPVGRRLASRGGRPDAALPSSVDQLSDLVGRVALKDIVRESADIIERCCIEAALELTNDNRASAAEILGLSRQSLYVKMHRHQIGDLTDKSV